MAAPTFLGSGIRFETGSGTTEVFTLNIPAGTELIVLAVDHFSNAVTVSGVTIDGDPLTPLGTQIAPNGSREGGWAGTLANPTTGATVTCTVTFSGTQASDKLVHYFCFDDAPAIDVFQDWSTGSGSPVNFSLVTTQANDFIGVFVFDFATVAHGTISGFTENQVNGTSGGTEDYSESWYLEDAGAAATENFSWTQGGSPVTTRFAFAVRGAAGATNVAVGLASETDTAFAVDREKDAAVGLSSEADTAQAVTAQRIAAVGLASETDTAQPVAHSFGVNAGLAVETDTAQSVTAQRLADIGLASETDTAQPVTAARVVAVGLATETDTGQSVAHTRQLAAGLASETDTAFDVTAAGPGAVEVGLAEETDSAFAVAVTKTAAVGIASETDTGFAVTAQRIVAAGLASETDSAQAVTIARALEAGLAVETDTALALLFSQTVAVGLASESDVALPVTGAGGAVQRRDTGAGSGGMRAMMAVRAMIRRRRKEEEELILALIDEEDAA